jgi:hypothetical protein
MVGGFFRFAGLKDHFNNFAVSLTLGVGHGNTIRNGQVRWLAKGDIVGQVRFIEQAIGIAV